MAAEKTIQVARQIEPRSQQRLTEQCIKELQPEFDALKDTLNKLYLLGYDMAEYLELMGEYYTRIITEVRKVK